MSPTEVSQRSAVGIGELQTGRAGDPPLTAYGLGSCVGVSAFDPIVKVGGLAHVMLPDAAPDGAERASMPARYAHSGLESLAADLEALGAVRRRIVFKLAGGAHVLTVPGFSDRFDIGQRNVKSIKDYLSAGGGKITGEDVGGHAGRTVRFHVDTGVMTVRQVGDTDDHEI